MATALARGWARPVTIHDPDRERAESLARELGGKAVSSNAEVASLCDVVILCHKPAQLESVAAEIDGADCTVVSILGSVSLERIRDAYKATASLRVLPNLPVEVRHGVLCWPEENGEGDVSDSVRQLFAEVGSVVELPERQIEIAMALSSNAPAFFALVVEAMVDAGVRRGLPADLAHRLASDTLSGTAELLDRRGGDTLALRRQVTSPGGSTARGLAALERAGIRSALDGAVEAVLGE